MEELLKELKELKDKNWLIYGWLPVSEIDKLIKKYEEKLQ